jgi:hypothetical protein
MAPTPNPEATAILDSLQPKPEPVSDGILRPCPMQVSDEEKRAVALMQERYPTLDLMKLKGAPRPGKTNEPLVTEPKTPIPEWLKRTNAEEIAALQKEIAELEASMKPAKQARKKKAKVK